MKMGFMVFRVSSKKILPKMILLLWLSILSFGVCLPTDDIEPPIKKPKIDYVDHVPHLYNPSFHQPPTPLPQSYSQNLIHNAIEPPKERKTPIMKEVTVLQRIIAIGEINSNYNDLVQVLQSLRIINEKLDWTAKNVYLVQLGNSIGNGRNLEDTYSTVLVMSLWEKLITEARQHNSKVILLLGPNEVNTLSGVILDLKTFFHLY
jgi:hypothetical protein